MMIIEEVGALIMWLAVFIGWLIKGCKTNLFKECAKIEAEFNLQMQQNSD